MQTTQVLLSEAHLGTKLNNAISGERRGEFGLLLAMLSADARDMAQFHLKGADREIGQRLHEQFELPKSQTLLSDMSKEQVIDHSLVFQQQGLAAFHLSQCLQPEAVVTRGAVPIEVSQVLANCSLVSKAKYTGDLLDDDLSINTPHFVDLLVQQRLLAEIIV
ncbi:VC2046/SO_2500 family protein [Shewanella colwelliana]|uniref:VC2046/SO_2500 family protein n=1 Tax=Shewanella colwelliana TaxID=23 RepID=UPI0022AE748A|nr:VC2046/SO_2500 family protein [Shewanella colwelliana]MCZ4339801.1 VC2046/SO_2500 family protein [Shewanella colwelliana]